MFEDVVTVPAGWYPDPMGLPQLRWWNNHAWTELTTEARPPLVMQNPTRLAYADEELPTRRQQREQREREHEYAHLATDGDDARDAAAAYAPLTITLREIDAPLLNERDSLTFADSGPATDWVALGAQPKMSIDTIDNDDLSVPEPIAARTGSDAFDRLFTPRSSNADASGSTATNPRPQQPLAEPNEDFARRSRADTRLPIYTASVWIMAFVPVLLLVVSLLLLLGFGSTMAAWVTPGIWTASYVLVVALAIADRFSLGRAGYEHRASWAWALLTPPVYLIARSMNLARVGPLGFAPVLVWAALGLLQIGSVLVVPGIMISALPQVFTAQAEQSIASDASIIGADLNVSCTKTLPVLIGQTFSCAATAATGASYDVSVTLRRSNGWIDWHVDDWGIYTLSR